MKIAFKTDRLYTEHGQRIAAWVERTPLNGEQCCFIDFDRGIEEHFPFVCAQLSEGELARHVMHMYDHGQYRVSYIPTLRDRVRDVRNAGWDAWINQEGVKTVNYR